METGSIVKRIELIEKLKAERQTSKDMLDDSLINNDQYRKIKIEIESLQNDLKAKKAEIFALAENESTVSKLKDISQDLRQEREILATELVEYYRQTQATEILALDGTKLKLKFSAKLIPLNKNFES